MTEVVIGTAGDDVSADAAALGIAMARTLGAVPVIAHIRPEAWQVVGSGRVDAEWDDYLAQSSEQIVATTAAAFADDLAGLGGVTDIGEHRWSGVGLDELAARRHADYLVIGSAPGGRRGRITGGSTSERLLHGASVPVALAPVGYADTAPRRIARLVVALETTDHRAALAPVLELAESHRLDVVLMTIVRRATRIYGSKLGADAEGAVLSVLRADAEAALARALDLVPVEHRDRVTAQVLVGDDVEEALAGIAWRPGDLVVVGSSRLGAIRRVLLGDMPFRILRATPAPLLVMPRRD